MDDVTKFLPLIAILIGISSQFLPFLDTRKDFRERAALIRAALKENLALYLAELLNHLASKLDEPLRGDGKDAPDLVARYTAETWRAFDTLQRLARLQLCFKFGYAILFLAVIAAVLVQISIFAWPAQIAALKGVAFALIAMQLVAVVTLFFTSDRLDKYE